MGASTVIATIPGDGVGPEVVAAARGVWTRSTDQFGFDVAWSEHAASGNAIDAYRVAIAMWTSPPAARTHAILLGAVGGGPSGTTGGRRSPGAGLFKLRSELGLFANLGR